MRDLADVRSVIEPAATHHAALHRTEQDLHALQTALAATARAHTHSSADAAEADASFHRAPFNATGNDMLARMDLLLEPGLRVRDRVVHAHEQIDDPVPGCSFSGRRAGVR
ncbi:DNA-binding FadR family transcriptional regulator [Streptomyces sp. PvP037]|uniref:FCD domain-containing protein n=1 Tax=Streptomyces TaxID=1883 RepID=UPI0033243077